MSTKNEQTSVCTAQGTPENLRKCIVPPGKDLRSLSFAMLGISSVLHVNEQGNNKFSKTGVVTACNDQQMAAYFFTVFALANCES